MYTHEIELPEKNKNKMKISLIICLVFSISIGSLYSQNKTIKGRVITEDLEISPYTSIVINGLRQEIQDW